MVLKNGDNMIEELERLHRENPYPEDMECFNGFVETYHTQLILLREQARANNHERLYEAVEQIFEDYSEYTKDRTLLDYPILDVNPEYDSYCLQTVREAATQVSLHYASLWSQSKGIPLDHTGRHFTGGVIRWGDAASKCHRIAADITQILNEED